MVSCVKKDEKGIPTLYVDGKPFFAYSGEIHNSSASSLEFMEEKVWPNLRGMNMNSVIVPVYWELLEPEEGRFDYTLVDGLLAQAREGQGEKLDRLTQAQAALDALMAEESCFSLKDLAVNGRDLIAQGFPAGPGLGTVLQGLLDAVLDERVENSREALLAWARAMNQPQKGD